MSEPMPTRELTALHETYVAAVNDAVARDDFELVDRLAEEYDREALALTSAA